MKVRFGFRVDGALKRLRWAGHRLAEEIESRSPRDRVRAADWPGAARREVERKEDGR